MQDYTSQATENKCHVIFIHTDECIIDLGKVHLGGGVEVDVDRVERRE